MGKAVPTQNPAVVLRSHFNQLRALLAVALIAVVGLTAGVVIVAGDDDQASGGSSAQPIGHIEYGGFNPATGRPDAAPLPSAGAAVKDYSLNSATGEVPQPAGPRYDGGPEEGTRGIR